MANRASAGYRPAEVPMVHRAARSIVLGLSVASLAFACKGDDGDDPDDTPVESDTVTDSDTAGGGPDEQWAPYEATPIRIQLTPNRYFNTSFKWFNDPVAFEEWAGTAAPPELTARTHDLIVRTGRPGPFPGTWGDVLDLEASSLGRVRARVVWNQADEGCGVFDIPMPPTAAALIPVAPRRPRLVLAREDVSLRTCDASGVAEGGTCSVTDLCAEGLRCQGLTRGTTGTCRSADNGGTWALEGGAVPEGGDALVRTFEVSGVTGVDEDVLFQVQLLHPRPADLRMTLENPDGVVGIITNSAAYPQNEVIDLGVRGFPGTQGVNGTWTLRIYDDVVGQTGEVADPRVEIATYRPEM